ncbi:hypothetical protein K461DRAFT_293143 [Myriangium duriaei CBS 260.36]|uniref:Uncharacterized protein n=1 Tax=Myriangium duriaei CBS 260.36 TaxID=1168546 RepID=A0A9P4J6S9_9PEZI|nr:hypothetical protein K461DRAFT_293143 [Myriangium duriaei CBS 260.36]
MKNWATDGGAALKKQEGGCGAIATWQWTAATLSNAPYVQFTLPLTIRPGCVERAVASASGPQLSCRLFSNLQSPTISKRNALEERSLNGVNGTTPGLPDYDSTQWSSLYSFYKANVSVETLWETMPYDPMQWAAPMNGTKTVTVYDSATQKP